MILHEPLAQQLTSIVEDELTLSDVKVHHYAIPRLLVQPQHLLDDGVRLVHTGTHLLRSLASGLAGRRIAAATTDSIVELALPRESSVDLTVHWALLGGILETIASTVHHGLMI